MLDRLPEAILLTILEHAGVDAVVNVACASRHLAQLLRRRTDWWWLRLALQKGYIVARSNSNILVSGAVPHRPLLRGFTSLRDLFRKYHVIHRNWQLGRYTVAHVARRANMWHIDCDAARNVVGSLSPNESTVWDYRTHDSVKISTPHHIKITTMRFCNGFVVTICSDSMVRVWTPFPRVSLHRTFGSENQQIACISHDGPLLALGGPNGVVVVAEIESGRLLRKLCARVAPVSSIVVSTEANVVVAGTAIGDLIVWQLSSGSLKLRINTTQKQVFTLAIGKSRLLASGHASGMIRTWKIGRESRALVPLCRKHVHRSPVIGLEVKGDLLISGSDDGVVLVWDFLSMAMRYNIPISSSGLRNIRITDSRLCSLNMDGSVQMLDFSTDCTQTSDSNDN